MSLDVWLHDLRVGPRDNSARNRVHVLTITDPGDGYEKEWEIEHHEECPLVCAWFAPSEDGQPWWGYRAGHAIQPGRAIDDGYFDCTLGYEIQANGIDSLAITPEHADPEYVPMSKFEPEWRRLRPGRYMVEAWVTHYGDGDIDSGLAMVTAPPSLRVKTVAAC